MENMGKRPVVIKEIIEKLIIDQGKDSIEGKILENWDKIIDEKQESYSTPVIIKNKALIVNVSNSAWLYQLTCKKEKIIQNIKKLIGENIITDIRFKIGENCNKEQ